MIKTILIIMDGWMRRFHPIFFDDNIHNDAEDSIVSVRHQKQAGDPFVALSGI